MAALFLMDISWYENPYGLCAVWELLKILV
jgi:hypothetical protein